MHSYNGRGVLARWRARPMDPERICPDAMCELVATDQNVLYVLEDNYDGSFEEHFVWTFESIVDIDVTRDMSKSAGVEEEQQGRAGEIAQAVLSALSGVNLLPSRSRQRSAFQYLRVRYTVPDGRERQLCFEDFEGNPNKAVKFWRKNGARRAAREQ